MIAMIIFLFLTVVTILCTAYYLDYKKKKTNNPINTKNAENKKETISTKSKKKLSDILEIKIKDNIICLGNRYSVIVKLGNIDYNMLSNSEQDAIENILIQSTLAIDYPIQFFSTTEYIDTSRIITLLKENKTDNFKVNEYKNNLIEYLQTLMENRSVSIITNYAIISYDGLYENANDELTRKSNSFKSNMLRAKIVCEILNEDEIYNLIYRELNKNSATNISLLKKGEDKLYVGKKQKAKRNKYF